MYCEMHKRNTPQYIYSIITGRTVLNLASASLISPSPRSMDFWPSQLLPSPSFFVTPKISDDGEPCSSTKMGLQQQKIDFTLNIEMCTFYNSYINFHIPQNFV